MVIELSDSQKEMLAKCKESLQKNNLGETYNILNNLVDNSPNYNASDIGAITLFFDSKGIYIEDFLDYIPEFAFCRCNPDFYLKRWQKNGSLVIPPRIKKLETCCFASNKNSNPTQRVIMVGVKSIKEYAFAEWYNLKEVVFGGKLQTLAPGCFLHCTALEKIYVPNDAVAKLIIGEKDRLFPDSVKIINSNTQEEYK